MIEYNIVSIGGFSASGKADMIILPGVEGVFSIIKDRLPFVSLLKEGLIYIVSGNRVVEMISVEKGSFSSSDNSAMVALEGVAFSSKDGDLVSRVSKALSEEKDPIRAAALEKLVNMARNPFYSGEIVTK